MILPYIIQKEEEGINDNMTNNDDKGDNNIMFTCITCITLLIEHIIEKINKTCDKIMKFSTFLKELRLQITKIQNLILKMNVIDEVLINRNVILTLLNIQEKEGNSDTNKTISTECLNAVICFSEDGLEKQLVLLLKEKGYIHIAAQLACKFILTSDPQFLDLVHESDRINFKHLHHNNNGIKQPSNGGTNENAGDVTFDLLTSTSDVVNCNYLTLNVLKCEYHMIDDIESVNKAIKMLKLDKQIKQLGIDAEWQPNRSNRDVNPVALLQISTENDAFLFDLLKLEKKYQINNNNNSDNNNNNDNNNDNNDNDNNNKRCKLLQKNNSETDSPHYELIKWIFNNKQIIKYGFGVKEDIRRLKESYDVFIDMKINNLIDFRNEIKFKNMSLSNAIKTIQIFGSKYELDKRMQTSDWAVRPLTEQQMHYAAIDARCLLELVTCERKSYETKARVPMSGLSD